MAETGIKKEIAQLKIQVDDAKKTSSKICDKYDLTVVMNFYDKKIEDWKKKRRSLLRRNSTS